MDRVATVILGGGQGTRLWPLTAVRAKPAVPVAGKFRLIDVPISNSLRAGIDRISVLTQFLSHSLHRHINHTYRFDAFSQGSVNILAATRSMEDREWYQGTADAVRQNLQHVLEPGLTEIVILSGDQLYLMDLVRMIETHRRLEADLTIAVTPVGAEEAAGLGIMRIDDQQRVVDFTEKPTDPAVVERFTLDEATVRTTGVDADPGSLLASMGIYVFDPEALQRLLERDGDDFGKELIPSAVGDMNVAAYSYRGYWRDIGTIGAFHRASIELTEPLPGLNLYDPTFPIYTHPRFLPGSKVNDCHVVESILSDGSIIESAEIRSSIVGVRGIVRSGTRIDRSVIMGANYFEGAVGPDEIPIGVGRDCVIRDAVIDMDVRIGDGTRLVNESGVDHADSTGWYIRDGIIVVPKGEVVPAGTVV